MRVKLITIYVALVLITILGTPYLMVLGVVDGWLALIQELKKWHRRYWRSTNERAD